MKKIILFTLAVGMIAGCTEPTVKSKTTSYTVPMVGGEASAPLKTCVIEGCEYFTCEVRGGVVVSHKGNCKNLIHKRNEQQ